MSLELSPEAQARLNDRKWRRSQSKWMLWIYVTSSMLGAVGFARIAIKTKNATLKKYTYIFSGLSFITFLFMVSVDLQTTQVNGKDVTEAETLSGIGTTILVVNYGLQILFSLKANKIWLVFRAQNNNGTWTSENLGVKEVAQKYFTAPQELVKDALGISQEDYYSNSVAASTEKVMPPPPINQKRTPPPPPPSAELTKSSQDKVMIDLNSASVEMLMKDAGFDPVLAANTVVQREKRGGFSSFENFANDLELQPHQVAKFKPILVIGKRNDSSGNSGRILDI